jgi:multisubunit Na+/H+ antiporter MnhG subunit
LERRRRVHHLVRHGVESILRPFQDNRREAFWPVPFVFTMIAFTCVHLLHRGRSRVERFGFGMVAIASALCLLGNIGLQLHIGPLERLKAPLRVVVGLVGLVSFGIGILVAGIVPNSAGRAIILLELGSVLAAVLLLPLAPMLERGAYSGNVGKGIAMGI